ncbi:MAG: hypothetical protein F6J86_29845 [Symploca sp. SIO1B1]|nr:hypothetical protein [Symploca sp. SIO1B1]
MGKICIIGPRSSGKTTYLAGLAYWPDKQRRGKKSKFSVQAYGDAEALAKKAENIICEGASLDPTDIAGGIDDAPLYQFQVKINHWFNKSVAFDLVVRDYPGEIFDELANNSLNPLHEEFIDECLLEDVDGCLILLTEWTKGNDQFYSKVISNFLELMDYRKRLYNLRLAVVMSKCERGELWPGRLEPELDIFEAHLPRTTNLLRERIPNSNLNLYAISTFGVLKRTDPRPNRTDILGNNRRRAVLRETSHWRPYNMIAPLYWLSTGKKMRSEV